MGNIGFNPRTAAPVQFNKKRKEKQPRDQLSSPDDAEDTPLDDQPNHHQVLEFETHEAYETWFQSLSKYEIHPTVERSITTKTQKFKYPPNLSTFPYYRISYNCCGDNSCRLKLNYKFKPVRTLQLRGKIIVDFDPGIHQMIMQTVDAEKTVVTLQKEMTAEEKNYMKVLSTLHPSTAALQYGMRQLSGRFFDADLLDRISRKYRLERQGDESGSLEKLKDYGKLVEKNGGRFTISHDDLSMRITGVYVQSKLEVDLSDEYSTRLVFLDGTHNTTRFIMKAVPALSIDCFGYTCPLGLAAVEAESHDLINKVLINFHLRETMRHDSDRSLSSTVVTDRGHAWASPLSQVTSQHFFDTFHFFRDVESHKSEEHERFKKDMRRAIFHIFESEDDLLSHINGIEQYATDSGRKLLDYFKMNFRKIALTCTSKYYIGAWNGASSRIEGYMSSLKGKRTLRKLMESFTLTDLFSRHDDVTQRYQSRVKKTVNEMLEKDTYLTPFAYKAFQASLQNLHEFEILERSSTAFGDMFKVKREISVEQSRPEDCFLLEEHFMPTFSYEAIVHIPHDVLMHPTCTCRKYTSLLLPCGCIAFCFTQLNATPKRPFISENNLHRQYRVEYHPIYQEVLGKKLPPIAGMQFLPPITRESIHHITSIRYPKNERLRVSFLSGLSQKINDISITEPLLYKRAVSGLKGLLNFLHTSKNDNEDLNPAAIQAKTIDSNDDGMIREPIPKNNRSSMNLKRSNVTKISSLTHNLADNQDQSSGSPGSPIRKKPKSNQVVDASTAVRRRDPSINLKTSSSIPEDVAQVISGPDKKDGTDPRSLNVHRQHSSNDDREIQNSLNATTDTAVREARRDLFESKNSYSNIEDFVKIHAGLADRNDETHPSSSNVGGQHNTFKTLSASAVKDIIDIEEKDEHKSMDVGRQDDSIHLDGINNRPNNSIQSITQSPSSARWPNMSEFGKKIRVAMRQHAMPKTPPRPTPTAAKRQKNSVTRRRNSSSVAKIMTSTSSSSSSSSIDPQLEALFKRQLQENRLRMRSRLTRHPNYDNMTRLHYQNDEVEIYIYIGDRIGYYEATARFGDDRFYREGTILDIYDSSNGNPVIEMNNIDMIHSHQRICKLTDIRHNHSESLSSESQSFVALEAFDVEKNYEQFEDSKMNPAQVQNSAVSKEKRAGRYMEWSFVYGGTYYTNTCPLDSCLQLMYYIDRDYQLTMTKEYEDIFNAMKHREYALARGEWLLAAVPAKFEMNAEESVDLWGKCSDYVLDSPFFKWELSVQIETKSCSCISFTTKTTHCSEVYFNEDEDLGKDTFNQASIDGYYQDLYPSTCDKCKSFFTKKKLPQTSPDIMFVNVSSRRYRYTSRQILFNNTVYDWVGVIYCVRNGGHFYCQYVNGGLVYTYDGMKGIVVSTVEPSPNYSFSSFNIPAADKMEALFFVKQSLKKQI